ncbi:hypothetical protein [Halopiger xanaduensis]|uniref:Uncharacterized protein n=1 Tax=Halopiger xanaduensis (strain DSM 18323 / JCM 14033 / SH-6) TaxID=797210 RepID=F8DET0_HALXS|nr:hypothetical protein [Halopiger xanaduensis]AEH39520.1 hypothetical protein Halxa_0280 [Halopiger xanaduensis SH-6]
MNREKEEQIVERIGVDGLEFVTKLDMVQSNLENGQISVEEGIERIEGFIDEYERQNE